MSDVTITYKGSPIATMDASGTKTLTTSGKYCEDNIAVEYVKPSGGTPAIAIVDTPDSHGGVAREITALDISDSTLETADQLVQGVTGYNKNGVKLTGTAPVIFAMEYPVQFTNNTGAVVALNRLHYDSDTLIGPSRSNIADNATISYDGLATDGTGIWVAMAGSPNITYDGTDATYIRSGAYYKITIPEGFDGTIPFVLS